MNDDKIRELLHEAHAEDRPPPFVVPEHRRRSPVFALAAAAVFALVIAGYLFRDRLFVHTPKVDIALPILPAIHYPTDVLLPASGLEVPEPTKGLLQ
jgi:hypothetical protein